MHTQAGGPEIPRLAPGCDPTALPLSPEEGYLLSRIDGQTSWDALRQIGGMPAEQVDRCLSRWLDQGVVVVAGGARAAAPAAKPGASAGAVDPDLDLDEAFQQRVLDFEARLARPYHEILGVERTAPGREIKQAYFALSREFHPDRYFRREIGDYAERLDRIFKKVLEAYELLSDPTTRAEVDRAYEEKRSAKRPRPGIARHTMLAQRAKAIGKRKAKAKSFFEAGMAAFAAERWLEAAGNVRLAIAFDPENEAVRERFADVQRRAHEQRAQQLLREANGAYEMKSYQEALSLYEEALHFRPHDATANARAATLAWKIAGDLRRAKEYAAAACELEPEHGAHHRLLGQIFKEAGLAANAKRELRAALKLDGSDAEARAELKSLPRFTRGA